MIQLISNLGLMMMMIKAGTHLTVVPGSELCVIPPPTESFKLFLYNIIHHQVSISLNASLFLHFDELQHLDLSHNHFKGFVEDQGLEALGRLKKLEVLDLSSNEFDNSIMRSLGALKSLKNLSLGWNDFTNPFPYQELAGLENLQMLDLSGNTIFYGTLQDLEPLNRLKKLEVLDLSYNGFDNSILPSLGALKSLKNLSLSRNDFTNPFPFEELAGLENLRMLDLSGNGLKGTLGLQGLKHLFDRLKNLEVLDLSYNSFDTSIFTYLEALLSLKFLYLRGNNMVGTFRWEGVKRLRKLEVLDISGNNFNTTNLQNIGLLAPNIKTLYLGGNDLSGPITDQELGLNGTRLPCKGLCKLNKLQELDLSQLDGNYENNYGFVDNIGVIFPNLVALQMPSNAFIGKIPSSIGSMRWLQLLDLSGNSLSGQIPMHLVTGCSRLYSLKLSNNNLHGQMLPIVSNLTGLRHLFLDGNKFTRNIPHSLSRNVALELLNVRNNNITGRLPGWIGNLSYLKVLIMANNQLEGALPASFCALGKLSAIDLSNNYFSGAVPSCFSPRGLRYAHFEKNKLEGPMTEAFSKSTSLVTLDMSDNLLNGSLPTWIGNLLSLGALLLKRNQLEGNIPIQICHLKRINIMDLSHNNLSGPIPSCLKNLTFKGQGYIHDGIDARFEKGYGMDVTNLFQFIYTYKSRLEDQSSQFYNTNERTEEQVEFTTKSRYDVYTGIVLGLMLGLDLSCNQLAGDIPPEIGELYEIRALNFSHNLLSGHIPTTISNLKQLESLDLSYNNLVGSIPPQMIELYSLSTFMVAHNNLSGKIPEWKGQFATFGESSYEGNPLLCGKPLEKNCTSENREPSPTGPASNDQDESNNSIDMDAFIVSFVASYIVVLLGVATVFYINPYWRRLWFYLVDVCITSCYYFALDNLRWQWR
uniref:Disease resistance R13L4/SHOC-2-like LRR domain-containing protein n=1 Tax=Nelumbo nucifera TaxID=4432 RepID=A0A822ZKP1_NELNU|nr:TPA_asm: hypothetical protein HUJ06_003310 [Nelumbo nucifera]